jgi:hypothetical protein
MIGQFTHFSLSECLTQKGGCFSDCCLLVLKRKLMHD